MNEIIFGEINSYLDFGLVLTSKTIGTPTVKTAEIDIPGGDGVLDLTEYFGDTKYNNRPLVFEFTTISPRADFLELFSIIQNSLHGKKMRITLSDDPEFYYMGRIKVDEWKSDKRIGKITIEVDAEPYKYRNQTTVISKPIAAASYITCVNLHKAVVPTITAANEVTITYGTYSITFSGTITDDNIILKQGENFIYVNPTVSTVVTVEYQERGL